MGRAPPGGQDRDGRLARQPLRGRPALVGATVELVFDPFDLTTIEVRYQNRPMGTARPVKVGRHVHPQAKPEVTPTSATAQPTGIDYLAMVEAKLAAQTRRTIAYAELPLPGLEPDPTTAPLTLPASAPPSHPPTATTADPKEPT